MTDLAGVHLDKDPDLTFWKKKPGSGSFRQEISVSRSVNQIIHIYKI